MDKLGDCYFGLLRPDLPEGEGREAAHIFVSILA